MENLNGNLSEIELRKYKVALHMQEFFEVFYMNRGLQNLIDKASEIFGRPLLVHDTSFKVLALSYDADQVIKIIEDDNRNKYLNEATIQMIRATNIARTVRRTASAGYVEKAKAYHGTLLSLIKINGIEVAHLAIFEYGIKFEETDYELIDAFSKLLAAELQKSVFDMDENLLPNYILTDLLDGKAINLDIIKHKFHYLKLIKPQSLHIMVLADRTPNVHDSKLSLILQALGQFLPLSFCTVYKAKIVGFIEQNIYSHLVNEGRTEFLEFLEISRLNVGFSLESIHISECKRHYDQAIKALEIGVRFGKCLTLFEDCQIYILSDFIKSQYEITDFCHPSVMHLMNLDRAENSELLMTLKNYIHFTHSPNEAAKALNIHRNTLFYRINKIKELTGINLDSAQEICRIYFSIHLLETNGLV